MNLELFEFVQLLNKALEERKKEKIWQRWLAEMPHMREFISFEDYYKKFLPLNVSQKPKEEILSDVAQIRKMAEGR